MPSAGRPRRVVLSPEADLDIRELLAWSKEKFGGNAAARYRSLLQRALGDIGDDPSRPGSESRPELGRNIRVFHLRSSRDRAKALDGTTVRQPRHFVIYRMREERIIDILRILHDSRDLERTCRVMSNREY